MSYRDYQEGSATESYRRQVDRAIKIGEQQKQKVDSCFYGRIDHLVDLYARKLAENLNEGNRIMSRVPSMMIAGGNGIQAGKKEKQTAAAGKNRKQWQEIEEILDRIRSTGKGGISADREDAVQCLEEKLRQRETLQEKMKTANAYFRSHHTLEGCEALTQEEIRGRMRAMEDMLNPKPYPSFSLSNNSAEIRRLKKRIEQIKKDRDVGFCGWEFAGGRAEANKEYNRLQLFFEEKPSLEQRGALRRAGFHWADSVGAWQRQLNSNAIRAAGNLDFLKPLDGRTPMELQPAGKGKPAKDSVSR